MLVSALAILLTPAAPQSFGPEQILSTIASSRRDVIAADVDDDGDIDLISVGMSVGQVGWLKNGGAGEFGLALSIEAELPNELSPNAADWSDLDGDTLPDLIISSNAGFGVGDSIFWYRALGGGEFGPRMALTVLGGTSGVVAEDLDGDGDTDVAYIDRSHGVSWQENLGDGAFGPQVLLTTGAVDADALDAIDLDGDGYRDLVWADTGNDEVRWLRSLGGGDFAPAESVGGSFPFLKSVLAVDIDQDGNEDLIVGGLGTLFLVENTGNGQFEAAVQVATQAGGSIRTAASDLDDDGDLDLLVSGQLADSFGWYENVDGQIGPRTLLSGTENSPSAVLAVDLDSDGDPDPVHAGDEISWFRNSGGGATAPMARVTRSLLRPRLFDMDMDGDLDLLGFEGDSIVLSGNLGDGSFGRKLPLVTGLANLQDVVALDVGGDGDVDLLASVYVPGQPGELLLLERTAAGLGAPVQVYALTTPVGFRMTVAELDADGDSDLVLRFFGSTSAPEERRVWIRNDAGAGLTPLSVETSDGFGVEAWGDVTGNGTDDLVLLSRNDDRLYLYKATPDGALEPPTTLSIFGPGGGDPLDLGDLDGDGDLDVVFYQGGNPSVAWCENLGQGIFAPREFLRVLPTVAFAIRAIDVDLDGDDDIIAWGNRSFWGPSGARWLESFGDGTFSPARELPGSTAFDFVQSVEAADIDGDGDVDLLKRRTTNLAIQLSESLFGTEYCGPAVPNSTGHPGRMIAEGSASIDTNALTIRATQLPPGAFGYFLVSDQPGSVGMPGGSSGNLCLGGSIGRLNRTGEVFQASAGGDASLAIDLTQLPTPTGTTSAAPGESLYFQAWHRDANPTATSNFTSGVSIVPRQGE